MVQHEQLNSSSRLCDDNSQKSQLSSSVQFEDERTLFGALKRIYVGDEQWKREIEEKVSNSNSIVVFV